MNEENNNRNEEQNSMNDQPQDTWRPDYTIHEKEENPQADQGPQPMPSSDNMYRFQNAKVEQKAPKAKKERGTGGMKKTIIAAVVFGVVAAVCFFGLIKISGIGNGSGDRGAIDTVDTSDQNTGLKAVSGAAAGPGDGVGDR